MTVEMTDDLLTGCVTYLAAQSEITDLLGSDDVFATWIFRDDCLAVVEGTEESALVVRQQGSWATPNPHNTMRFPRLVVEFYVDPDRDDGGNPVVSTTSDVADHLFKVVDSYLHRPQGGDQMWGDLRTLGCARAGELDRFEWGDVDKTEAYRVNYDVAVG